jgi:hypothetical protein
MKNTVEISQLNEAFSCQIRQIIASARSNAVRSVDFCRVQMYPIASALRTQYLPSKEQLISEIEQVKREFESQSEMKNNE